MAGRGGAVAARERARQAQARVAAARVERDRQIEQVTTDFFLAAVRVEQAKVVEAGGRSEMAAAVHRLMAPPLSVPVEEVATLTDLSTGEVRALRRQAPAEVAKSNGDGPRPVTVAVTHPEVTT